MYTKTSVWIRCSISKKLLTVITCLLSHHRAENEKLKQDIQEWKGKLVAAEKANGIEQVASGNAKQTKEVTPAPSAEEKKANPDQDKKKSEKKKKEKAPPPAKPSEAEEVHVGR